MQTLPWFHWIRRPQPTILSLQNLPDDVLARIITALMSPVYIGPNARLVEHSYKNALSLALTSKRFYFLFMQQLIDCEFWQSGTIDDRGLCAIARDANSAIRRMILRKCSRLTRTSFYALSTHCSNVHTIDFSHIDISDADLAIVIAGTAKSLRSLFVRECTNLTDDSLTLIGTTCTFLEALDICALRLVTDAGIDQLARGLRHHLTMIVCSGCIKLTDQSLYSLGRWCPRLEVVTCRALPLISNAGLDALCRGVRDSLSILDILHCDHLKVNTFLHSARRYCPQLAKRYDSAEGKTLKQLIIPSLSGFIFHVTGSDIHNGKAAVYFLLVDSGTSNSFRVSIGSSSLDLTNYGSILASCFGESPNEHVKQTLLCSYGLDLDADESASHRDIYGKVWPEILE